MDDTRILDKLDDISDRMARVEVTVTGLSSRIDKYNHVTGRTTDLEHAVEVMQSNCARVQADKKRWQLSPGQIIGGIMGSTAMLLIGYAAAFYLG